MGRGRSTAFSISSKLTELSTPERSVTNRLRARMEIGASMAPRRQAASQGWAQILPHTDAKGCQRVSHTPPGIYLARCAT
jgi:hypothetical protein